MFSEKFIATVVSVGNTLCAEAETVRATGTHKCVSRENIVDAALAEMGEAPMDSKFRGFIFNMLVDSGLVSGFELARGQYGGVIRVEGSHVKAAEVKKELTKAAKQAERDAKKLARKAEKDAIKAALKAAKLAEKLAATQAAVIPAIVTPEPTVAETV